MDSEATGQQNVPHVARLVRETKKVMIAKGQGKKGKAGKGKTDGGKGKGKGGNPQARQAHGRHSKGKDSIVALDRALKCVENSC